jgi:hypothetical protein
VVHRMKPPDENWWKYESRGLFAPQRDDYELLGTAGTVVESCYRSHKPLVLGDTGLSIHGGSCSSPVIKDADVYIGFDGIMTFTERSYPWNPGHEILFRIADRHAPANAAEFRKLVDWAAEQLHAGKKVHCGCIGGHGRTGTFFAALVSVMLGEKDAIAYVRERYCKKAIESEEQIRFLVKEFGITAAAPRRTAVTTQSNPPPSWVAPETGMASRSAKKAKAKETIYPMRSHYSIWGD